PGVVEVAGRRYTARDVVLATGSDPVTPPVPGLRELDGVWSNREVTGMKAVPRRLLILGGGPVGAEMAQAVHRLGGEVALIEGAGGRPRPPEGLDTVGVTAGPNGVPVDAHLRVGERLWAIGDVTGIRLLTHVGKYQGEVVASNLLGEPREAHYDAIPDVIYTDPQAAAVGASEAPFSGTGLLSEVAKTETYTHAYAQSRGFMTLLSDGERLT